MAASVLLKLFINESEKHHSIDASYRMSGTLIFISKQHETPEK